MRRRCLIVLVSLVAVVLPGGVVLAASANAEPENQTRGHGVASHWTLIWGGDNPFDVDWLRGDGSGRFWRSTNFVGAQDSHVFAPCFETQYTQVLRVWDSDDGFAQDYTRATEEGGACK